MLKGVLWVFITQENTFRANFALQTCHLWGGKNGSIWQNYVLNPVLKGFLTLYLIKHSKMLEDAGPKL